MLELMLAFHAWYKMGHPFCLKTKKDKMDMLDAIRTMMKEILKNAPRNDKNGWKLQKFHDMLHIVRDIENFGSPKNVDAAPNENNLIDFAKRPGKRAHKKREVFVSQVSKRLRETDLIRKAFNALSRTLDQENTEFVEMEDINMLDAEEMDDDEVDIEENAIHSVLVGKPLFCVHLDANGNDEFVECLAGKTVQKARQLHPIIGDFIYQKQFDRDFPLFGQKVIEIYTDYKRNGTTYRAHPNYNSSGEWYDWAMIRFEIEEEITHKDKDEVHGYYEKDLFPGKILCFLKSKDDSIEAIVHCCMASDHKGDGILVERWNKEFEQDGRKLIPLLRCVSVDCFEELCFVVEDKPGLMEEYGDDPRRMNNGVTLVKPREKAWPKAFFEKKKCEKKKK